MEAKAMLFYGSSVIPAAVPNIQEPFIMPDVEVARLCLKYMSRQAGDFLATMSQDVVVSRHPKGLLSVRGNGWSVTYQMDAYLEAAKAAAVVQDVATWGAFVSQITETPISVEQLTAGGL